ncbi:MAG: tRNA uridine-5-carboxymethylaminomethyl(34) synthesis enzyme MnmG [Armatimonadota bacterium]
MLKRTDEYDVLVVGGGHAGCEAALAAARMGCHCLLVTMNLDTIAHMPCNCSVGGPAKGHVVREIDALGGEMALAADFAATHVRMLNTSKGPAVQALRAQVDKRMYHSYMKRVLERQPMLHVKQGTVEELVVDGCRVAGVRTRGGMEYRARTVVMTTGTFLRGVVHVGERRYPAGRAGEAPAEKASDSLRALGFALIRLKTGTTARVDARTVDFQRMQVQPSDESPRPFSFMHDRHPVDRPLLPAWVTHTTPETHGIIRRNLERSAMYGGRIQGVGPRYCPSIEDKIVKFPHRERHTVFLEQEGWETHELYVQGMSTSLPEEVQDEFLRTLPGLENVDVMRYGYAIEYDAIVPTQLYPWLESKYVEGLFFAGQINGTSGYEEAAAQGLVAGINAALKVQGREPLILRRSESYIGVMIDDLVTKGIDEPYRLLTSRAEHRLLLRQDNADERLTPIGRRVGLVSDARWEQFHVKRTQIRNELSRLGSVVVTTTPAVQQALAAIGTTELAKPTTLLELLRRPEVSYAKLSVLDPDRQNLPLQVAEAVEIEARYEGYIRREEAVALRAQRLEETTIPDDLDYTAIRALSREGREKLSRVRPRTLGQASRIPGLTPSDLSLLAVYLHAHKRSTAGLQ